MTAHLIPRSIYWATDVNPFYLETLDRLRPSRPYLQTAYVDAMEESSFPQEVPFDTVICLNVVEHLSDDVGALRNIYNVLETGGRAIVLVPNGPGLFGTLDKVLGIAVDTRKINLTIGREAGFTVEKVLKFNRPGVPAWWLNGRDLRKTTFGLGQIRLLNFFTPLFRVMDSWLPLPPLSLIAIFGRGWSC